MKTIIKGNPVSKMEDVKKFTPLDQLIVSKVHTLIDQIPHETAESFRVQYGDLSSKLIHDIKEALHLSSMAYMDVEDYSKLNHTHDYTKVRVYPYFRGEEYRKVGNISVDGTEYDIRIPNYPEITYEEPKIGEFKMIYTPSFGHLEFVGLIIDTANEDFSGWVPADGKEYQKSDFPSAFEYFKTQQDTTTFHVPKLSDFFCGNTGKETSDQLRSFPQQIGMGKHAHVKIKEFGELDTPKLCATIQIPTTTWEGTDPYCHSGGDVPTGYLTQFSCDIDIKGDNRIQFSGGQCEYAEITGETYPTYNMLPILVYIGRKGK